jgi:hypothetical protein
MQWFRDLVFEHFQAEFDDPDWQIDHPNPKKRSYAEMAKTTDLIAQDYYDELLSNPDAPPPYNMPDEVAHDIQEAAKMGIGWS